MRAGGVLAALAILVALIWLLVEWSSPVPFEELTTGPTDEEVLPSPGERLPPPRAGATESLPAERRVAGAVTGAGPTCIVFGWVIDEAGSSLADVGIYLYSVGGGWGGGTDETPFSTRTDSFGRFELRAPLPSSDWVALDLRPSRFHSLASRHFGRAGGRDEDPLIEGENDLGTFVLTTTGAIAGRVSSRDGQAVHRAYVRIGGRSVGGHSLFGIADEAGRYTIEHTPPGTYELEAIAKGYVTGRLHGIEVHERAVTEWTDFVLDPASSISGRVVDGKGNPLEGVRLVGAPRRGGQGARSRTDAEGNFTMYLSSDRPVSIAASKEGYVTFGEGPRRPMHRPGTTGLEILLRGEVRTEFKVVDANTGRPVERFGLRIGKKPNDSWGSSAERRDVPLRDHPGGMVTLAANPKKHAYSIQAPGYAPQRESVQYDTADQARQTIRLEAEARILGRVLLGEQPVAGATVRLKSGSAPRRRPSTPESSSPGQDAGRAPLDEFTGRLRLLTTDGDGRFDIGELAVGTYRVELNAPGVCPLIERQLVVRSGQVLDLGDLRLIAGGTVRGRVVFGFGIAAPELEVRLDGARTEARRIGPGGTFEFSGLGAGRYQLIIGDLPGVVLGVEPFPFEIAAGEEKEVLLDLTPYQPVEVRVRVHIGGEPVPLVRVKRREVDAGPWRSLHRIDGSPEVVTDCLAGKSYVFLASSLQRLYLGSQVVRVEAAPGEKMRAEMPVEAGWLEVAFPEGFDLPKGGRATVSIHTEEGTGTPGLQTVQIADRRVDGNLRWVGSVNDLGPIAAGDYRLEVEVRRPDGESRKTRLVETGDAFQGQVTVEMGRRVTCSLVRDG